MKFFFSKAERTRLLGFDDFCYVALGLFPLAGLGHILFGGANPGLTLAESSLCFGISVGFTLVYWVASRFTVLQFHWFFPRESQTVQRILLMLLVLFIMVVAVTYLGASWLRIMEYRELIPEPPLFYKIVMSFTLVVLVLAIYEGIYFFTKYRQSIIERERLAKENMQSQLSVLKQQMNPHFLFNSLNTLVNIIPEDTRKSIAFTQRLAAVYRRILEWRHKELITLGEEVAALEDYVFLMQTRFENKLEVCWNWRNGARTQVHCEGQERGRVDLPPKLSALRIVPLSVQLLVENAIKHNVVSSEKPLRIDIAVSHDRITVANPLNLRTGRSLDSTGWGHENLRTRYEMITSQPIVISQTTTTYQVSVPLLNEQDHVARRVAV